MAKLMDSDHDCSPSYNERFLKIRQKHMNALIEKGFTVTLEDVICELGLDPERNFKISFPELAGNPLISAADFGFTKENPKFIRAVANFFDKSIGLVSNSRGVCFSPNAGDDSS